MLELLAISAMGQPMFYFRNLDVSKGLPNNSIHSICEDRQGFMWIGTRDGLSRYDGVSFESFYHDASDTNSIGGNSISWDMQEDALGRLWITLHGHGLSRFDPRSETFTNFSFANRKFKQEWTNDAEQLVMLPNGDVLLICQGGIVRIDATDRVSTLVDFNTDKSIAKKGSLRFAALHEGRWLWVASATEFLCIDLNENRWLDGLANSKLLSRNWNANGCLYHEGKLWFSTYFKPENSPYRFLYSYDFEKNSLDSIPIAPAIEKGNAFSDQVHAIHIDRKGTIWLGTEGIGLMGLVSFDPETQRWTQYYGTADWTGSILAGAVRTFFEDRKGNMWIGTERGISLMAPDRQYFLNYVETRDGTGKKHSLQNVTSLAVGDDGQTWLGNDGNGMFQLDGNLRLEHVWKDLPNTSGTYRNYLEPRVLLNDTLIFHGWYHGLSRLETRTGKVFNYEAITDVNEPEIRSTFQDSKGNIYAFGWGRFGRLNIRTGNYEFVRMPLNTEGRSDLVMDATEDRNGNIWLGLGQTGMVCVNPSSMTIIDGWTRDTMINPKTSVWSLVHQRGKIYFSYAKERLGVLDINSKELQTFSKKDGICSNEITGVLKDADGGIWLYSSSGISWFDEANGRFRTFSEADGMISENVQDAALLPSGNILLVTDRGLIQFDPKRLKTASNHQRPSLRSIQVYDQTLNIYNWAKDSLTVRIPYDRNYLRVEFSALEFFDPEKIQFAYRLDGAEERWNYTDHRPVAIYTNLRGGDYRLCVKRTNTDGVWGPELCVPVFVTTPFYRQLWFVLLMVLVVAVISFLIYRWQLRKKLAVLEVRNQLSRDLHDDIGSALSSINIFSSVAEQQMQSNQDETKKLLQRIGSSARGMMQSMDDIIWAIDPNNDQLENLVPRMRAFAVPILEAKDILLKMNVGEEVQSVRLDMVKRKNLFLIFKEAINNLAKYSEAKNANVEIAIANGKLNMTITDDGIGFDTSAETTRNGLKNMQKRAAEVGGSASISSENGKGTTVSVSIPLT